MNARSLIICVFLAGMVALWNVPRVVRASKHGVPEAEGIASSQVAEEPRVETLPEAQSEGEGEAGAAVEFKLGQPLNGHFDINVLRSAGRILKLRYPLQNIVLTVRGANGKIWAVNIGCEVEFGSESGVAEITRKDEDARKEIQDLVRKYSADVLLKTSGKLKLKGDIIQTIDRLLETASVRGIYLTAFQLTFISGS